MSKILEFPVVANEQEDNTLTLQVPRLGISKYPAFVGRDFSRAYNRFFIAAGAAVPTDDRDIAQCAVDIRRYADHFLPHRASKDDLMISFEEIEAFLLLVTGHPRFWYAAWFYDMTVNNILCYGVEDGEDRQHAINDAYAFAISMS